MNEKELQQILDQHELWLETSGEQGQRANLKNADLRGVDLSELNLQRVNFQGADLQHINLFSANLEGADLRGAKLRNAYLDHSDLRGVKFDHGILECNTLIGTKWLKTDIPWFIQHPGYSKWADTIQILDE